jgi:23S rRNA-/tRNA-specific pseudouridylate synthase
MREAETFYKVLKRFEIPCSPNFSRSSLPRLRVGSHTVKNLKSTTPFSFLEIHPKTGRTHQIRVHMKYLNHPVVCDSLYNPNGVCPKGLKRMALHAKSIEFNNLKGEIVKIESPVPLEFKKVVK